MSAAETYFKNPSLRRKTVCSTVGHSWTRKWVFKLLTTDTLGNTFTVFLRFPFRISLVTRWFKPVEEVVRVAIVYNTIIPLQVKVLHNISNKMYFLYVKWCRTVLWLHYWIVIIDVSICKWYFNVADWGWANLNSRCNLWRCIIFYEPIMCFVCNPTRNKQLQLSNKYIVQMQVISPSQLKWNSSMK